MIVINANDDLDILLNPKEVLSIGYVKNPGTPEERRGKNRNNCKKFANYKR